MTSVVAEPAFRGLPSSAALGMGIAKPWAPNPVNREPLKKPPTKPPVKKSTKPAKGR